jgi:hypothetical protein
MEEGLILESKNKNLKVVVFVLTLLLLGSVAYIYKVINDSKAIESVLIAEKKVVQKNLAIIKDSLDIAIASNTVMSEDLMIERDKVVKLMAEIETSKSNISSIQSLKSQFSKLKQEVNSLVAENNSIKKLNSKLIIERDSTSMALAEVKKNIDTLSNYNRNLARTVEKGSKLSIINVQGLALKIKGSGKQLATDKASRTDLLKISFAIAENQIAKPGDRVYYIQVYDSNNTVLGENFVENFGTESLTYSFKSTIKFQNQMIQTTKDIAVKDLKKGTYYINVFDKREIVAKTSFELK